MTRPFKVGDRVKDADGDIGRITSGPTEYSKFGGNRWRVTYERLGTTLALYESALQHATLVDVENDRRRNEPWARAQQKHEDDLRNMKPEDVLR